MVNGYVGDMVARKVTWQVVAGLSAASAAFLTQRLLMLAWKASGHDANPEDDPDLAWPQAVAWGLAAGAAAGAARVVARRVASSGFERATGEAPPTS